MHGRRRRGGVLVTMPRQQAHTTNRPRWHQRTPRKAPIHPQLHPTPPQEAMMQDGVMGTGIAYPPCITSGPRTGGVSGGACHKDLSPTQVPCPRRGAMPSTTWRGLGPRPSRPSTTPAIRSVHTRARSSTASPAGVTGWGYNRMLLVAPDLWHLRSSVNSEAEGIGRMARITWVHRFQSMRVSRSTVWFQANRDGRVDSQLNQRATQGWRLRLSTE